MDANAFSDTELEAYNDDYASDECSDDFFTSWQYLPSVNGDEITIDTGDCVTEYLLDVAKNEMDTVARRVITALNGKTATCSNIGNLLLRKLVPLLMDAMNSGRRDGDDAFTILEAVEFVRCIAVLSFYRVTPTRFFKSSNLSFYPPAEERCESIWKRCLLALSRNPVGVSPNNMWKQPFDEDPLIRRGERNFGEVMAPLCFVDATTILSTDDDQYRLSSKRVDEIGLVRVNIPKKALGPVSQSMIF